MALFGPPDVGKLAARQDLKGLIKALGYRQDAPVRGAAAQALGLLGDARAVEPLVGALHDQDWQVRDPAVEALGRIDDARAAEALIGVLKDGWLSSQVGSEQTVKALAAGGPSTVGPLADALRDKDKSVRVFAAYAFAMRDDSRAVPVSQRTRG